jgi:hypothetical protein
MDTRKMPDDEPAAKRSRTRTTVSDDITCIRHGDTIERQIGSQFVGVDGTLFRVSTQYLETISEVYASMDAYPVVWKINGVTDPVVFLATLRHLHPVGDTTRVVTKPDWSPHHELNYIGTPWVCIIDNIKRLESLGEYGLAGAFLHSLDQKHRKHAKWNPRTIMHWLAIYAGREPDDTGSWIDIDAMVSGGIGNRKLSVHESILYAFLFTQVENVPCSRALICVLRRWPIAIMKDIQQQLLQESSRVFG